MRVRAVGLSLMLTTASFSPTSRAEESSTVMECEYLTVAGSGGEPGTTPSVGERYIIKIGPALYRLWSSKKGEWGNNLCDYPRDCTTYPTYYEHYENVERRYDVLNLSPGECNRWDWNERLYVRRWKFDRQTGIINYTARGKRVRVRFVDNCERREEYLGSIDYRITMRCVKVIDPVASLPAPKF